MDFEEWLAFGRAQRWCGPAVCATHDGTPTSEDEDSDFEEGYDPCIHVIRLYPDEQTRLGVEANHSPSTWR